MSRMRTDMRRKLLAEQARDRTARNQAKRNEHPKYADSDRVVQELVRAGAVVVQPDGQSLATTGRVGVVGRVQTPADLRRAMRAATTPEDVLRMKAVLMGIALDEDSRERVAAAKLLLAYMIGTPEHVAPLNELETADSNRVVRTDEEKRTMVLQTIRSDGIFRDPKFLNQVVQHLYAMGASNASGNQTSDHGGPGLRAVVVDAGDSAAGTASDAGEERVVVPGERSDAVLARLDGGPTG